MLTGRFQFKKTLTGKVVLQVEEDVKSSWPSKRSFRRLWRNASLMDLASTELRPLMDLQHRRPSLDVEVSATEGQSPNVVPMAARSMGAKAG